jgi:uncharacterized protein YjbI with pentapeptide repeats
MRSRSPIRLAAIGVGATLAVAVIVIVTLLQTGGQKAISQNAAVIGALVALGGVFTTQLVNSALENQRAQDDALQKYLDQVSDSETYKDLRTAKEEGYKRAVMRAKMKTLLLALEGGRKSILLLFLNEAKLVKKSQYLRSSDKKRGWNYPILELEGIDFSGAKLDHIEVDFADLSGANLSKTDLRGATFGGVNLHDADLSGANLSEAKLLTGNKTKLVRTTTTDGKAETYDPERVGPMPELLKMDLSSVDLRGADLTGADLTGADLTGANLSRANLSEANLSGAILSGAILSGANISGAILFEAILSQEQLEQALGDENSQLPPHLRPPAHWGEKTDEQPEED